MQVTIEFLTLVPSLSLSPPLFLSHPWLLCLCDSCSNLEWIEKQTSSITWFIDGHNYARPDSWNVVLLTMLRQTHDSIHPDVATEQNGKECSTTTTARRDQKNKVYWNWISQSVPFSLRYLKFIWKNSLNKSRFDSIAWLSEKIDIPRDCILLPSISREP